MRLAEGLLIVSALPQTPATARVLQALTHVKARETYWVATCPAHDDDVASLTVSVGRKGQVLLKCHAGCELVAIVDKMGLVLSDLWPDKPSTNGARKPDGADAGERPTFVKSYDYVDRHGTLVFQSCRFVYPNGKKTFRQRRPDGKGDWIYNIGDTPLVLYRLPDVLAAVESGRTVYVVEGEKDADTLAQYGYPTTTNPMGAGKWSEQFSDCLVGADEIIIFPDNDEPGRAHAQQIAASLTSRKCRVRVVELPGLRPKGDVSDWLADDTRTLDELNEMVGRTPFWTPDPSKKVRWSLREVLSNDEWMKPPQAIVPRFAWESRSTLLASTEKSGKSTLAGYLATQVSIGGHFLGASCVQGHVLIVGLEEFIGDTARRLRHFGANQDAVTFVTRFLGDPLERPQELRAHIVDLAPRLTVVDTLVAYAAGAIDDAAKSAQMQPVVQGITDVAHQTGCSLMLIHHARRSDGKYRDSSAIGGAVDVIAEVFTPDESGDPTLRRANVRGRIPSTFPFDFRFDGDTYTLATSSEAPLELRIVEYVRDHPGCHVNDVAAYLMGNRKRTLATIAQLLAGQHLLNHGTGRGHKLIVPTSSPGSFFPPTAA